LRSRILGDLALPFRGFEISLKVIQKDDVTFDHGYAQPEISYEKTFKGILIDRATDMAEIQGVRSQATRLLYVRLSQSWIPDLVEGDIVIDNEDKKWKIVERFDYTIQANTKVFGVTRVDP